MSGARVHELLERLGNLLRSEARRLGAERELQPVQAQALAYLARCNRYSNSPQAVAEYLGLTKGTVSQTLQVLQQRGLVQATPDPDDARRVHLQPTAKGRRMATRLVAGELAAVLDGPAHAGDLAARLERLLVDLQRARGGRTFGVCRTCHHFRPGAGDARCGLTDEPLATEQTSRICREHEPGKAT
ncbi:MAG: winged helix-turn-helix transcriptional regulator [Planctomycetes bacterium]|nr:winged helix-turn-helix transcriptional regulator [Planctomycetota bacterium]